MKNFLKGAYDLHIHTAPDVIARKYNDRHTAQMVQDAGMAGFVVKNHYFETASRAALLQKEFPGLTIAGGITLNRSVGGINPFAVEQAGKMGARMLWFPTMDSREFQAYKHRQEPDYDLTGLLTVLDANGELTQEALDVLDTAAKYHMVVGTGHGNSQEGLKLVEAGCARGLKMVLTHVEHPAMGYTDAEQIAASAMGAYIEHSYNDVFFKRCTIEDVAHQIRITGGDRVFLSTDFGQVNAPDCDKGLALFAQELSALGFTDAELHHMMCTVPAQLLGIQ